MSDQQDSEISAPVEPSQYINDNYDFSNEATIRGLQGNELQGGKNQLAEADYKKQKYKKENVAQIIEALGILLLRLSHTTIDMLSQYTKDSDNDLNPAQVYIDYTIMESIFTVYLAACGGVDPKAKGASIALGLNGDLELSGERNVIVPTGVTRTVSSPPKTVKTWKNRIEMLAKLTQFGTAACNDAAKLGQMANQSDKRKSSTQTTSYAAEAL
ncbi:MAG: hypothetical protein LBV68_02280 [Spirochaetaceae bacterium]|jgi:hypothetical protein|nr:hypothetical protein [Spirochaetaceae bacterium]